MAQRCGDSLRGDNLAGSTTLIRVPGMEKKEMQGQMWLEVPFKDKGKVKGLGARWDAQVRKWYVPHGVDITQFKRWWMPDLKHASRRLQGVL